MVLQGQLLGCACNTERRGQCGGEIDDDSVKAASEVELSSGQASRKETKERGALMVTVPPDPALVSLVPKGVVVGDEKGYQVARNVTEKKNVEPSATGAQSTKATSGTLHEL